MPSMRLHIPVLGVYCAATPLQTNAARQPPGLPASYRYRRVQVPVPVPYRYALHGTGMAARANKVAQSQSRRYSNICAGGSLLHACDVHAARCVRSFMWSTVHSVHMIRRTGTGRRPTRTARVGVARIWRARCRHCKRAAQCVRTRQAQYCTRQKAQLLVCVRPP